jgi:phage shock protein A
MRRKTGEAWRRDAESLAVEFLKEHRKVEQQEATIGQLKKDFRATVAELNARLKAQDSKIEKVSAQIEVSRPVPQTIANDQ